MSRESPQLAEAAATSAGTPWAGIALLFLAGTLWSLNGALIKLVIAEENPPHGVTIAFYRSLIAGVFLAPLAFGKARSLTRPDGIRLLWRLRPAAAACVVFFTLMTACFVIATTMTAAANAIILQYTSTFWIIGLSPMILHERAARRELWTVALAMIGIAVIFAGGASTSLAGLIIALAAGFFYALETMMIRRMRDSDSAAVTVLNKLGSAALLLPAVCIVGSFQVSRRALILLAIMGIVQFGLPYYLYTLGLARVPAYRAALITMIEPVLVPVWAYIAVGEVVEKPTIAGGAMILAALLAFVWTARRRRGVA